MTAVAVTAPTLSLIHIYDEFFNDARRLGAHSLVFKPFSRIDLIRAIDSAVEMPDV